MVARLEVELARRADGLEDDVVVLAAGRRLVGGEVGDAPAAPPATSSSASAWAASAALTSAASSLVRASSAGLLLALRLRDLLAELLLLGPLGLEVARSPAGARRRRQRPVDHVVGQPALGLGGAHAVGVVTQQRGSIIGARLSAPPARGPHPRSGALPRVPATGRAPAPGILQGRVLDRPRLVPLAWAVLCFVSSRWSPWLVTQDWGPLAQFDNRGRPAGDWAVARVVAAGAAAGRRGDVRDRRA